MKRSLILFAMLGFGIVSYGKGCSVKPNAFTSIPVKGIEEVLNSTLLGANAKQKTTFKYRPWRRGYSCICYSSYSISTHYYSASSLKRTVQLTLGVDADHGSLSIRACRPDAIAYYVDGVRLRAGDITID